VVKDNDFKICNSYLFPCGKRAGRDRNPLAAEALPVCSAKMNPSKIYSLKGVVRSGRTFKLDEILKRTAILHSELAIRHTHPDAFPGATL
jgi:hypothetical protein